MLQASGLIGTTMVKFNVKDISSMIKDRGRRSVGIKMVYKSNKAFRLFGTKMVRKMDYKAQKWRKKSEGSYLQGKRVGHWQFWHSNGSKWSEGNYN